MKNKLYLFILLNIELFILFIYRFPDVFAFLMRPKDMVFLGQNPWFDGSDVNVYAAAIHYGQLGHILLPNLYTSIINNPIFIYPFYTILGFLLRNNNPLALFFVASILTGILLISGTYIFFKTFTLSKTHSLAGVITVCLGGGVGFLLYPYVRSGDISDAITFYDTFLKPHEGLAIFCYLAYFVLFYKVLTHSQNIFYVFLTSLALFILIIFYPYFIVTCFIISVGFWFFTKDKDFSQKDFLQFSGIFMPAIVMAVFIGNQLSNNTWSQLMQSSPVDYASTLFGFGILFPLALYHLFFLPKSRQEKYILTWLFTTIFFAFLPFGPGKLFLRGIFFPLVLTGIFTLVEIRKKYKISDRVYASIIGIFLLLSIGTSMEIFILRIKDARQYISAPQSPWIYMSQKDYNIFDYINIHIQPMKGFLAADVLGNQIPAFTHDIVYFGHLQQTPNTEEKLQSILIFYAGRVPKDKVSTILSANNISYVLWGSEEKAITFQYIGKKITSLSQIYPSLKKIYQTGDITLYTIN